jgi:ADP-ribose diphosphatase
MDTHSYQGKYFSIFLDKNGVEYVRTGNAAVIVPVTLEGEVILNLEPAPAYTGEMALVLPGGEIDPGESALESANRELQKEISYQARRLDFLGVIRPFAKYMQCSLFAYLARDLHQSTLPGDEDYIITTQEIKLAEVENWVAEGRLKDASTIAALFLARSFLSHTEKKEEM